MAVRQAPRLRFYHSDGGLLIKNSEVIETSSWALWVPIGGLIVVMTALQLTPPEWHAALRYERSGLAGGELWRTVTGHIIHLDWGHLGLNAAGAALVAALFADDWRVADWVLQLHVSAIAVTFGLYFFSPEIAWCVGLSGVLHGQFVYGAVGLALRRVPIARWLLIGVAAKLVWEQLMGELPMLAAMSSGSVVVDAHMYGAIGGLIAAAGGFVWRASHARV